MVQVGKVNCGVSESWDVCRSCKLLIENLVNQKVMPIFAALTLSYSLWKC